MSVRFYLLWGKFEQDKNVIQPTKLCAFGVVVKVGISSDTSSSNQKKAPYPCCREIGVEGLHDNQGGVARALGGCCRPPPPAPPPRPVLLHDGPHLCQAGGGFRRIQGYGVHQGRAVQRSLWISRIRREKKEEGRRGTGTGGGSMSSSSR